MKFSIECIIIKRRIHMMDGDSHENLICRLCANCEGSEIYTDLIDIEEEMRGIIKKILNINLDENDDKFPQTICGPCVEKLENILKYKNECTAAQDKLFEMLKKYEGIQKSVQIELPIESESDKGDGKMDENETTNQVDLEINGDAKIIKFITPQPFRLVEGRREYECQDCENFFGSKGKLHVHRKTCEFVGNEKSKRAGPFECEYCKKVFPTRVGYRLHRLYIHAEYNGDTNDEHSSSETKSFPKPFPCDLCDKEFSTLGGRNTHKHVRHSGKYKVPDQKWLKVYKVNPKSKPAKRDGDSKTQIAIKKESICHVCGKTFNTSGGLGIHMKFHQEKQYKCEICGKAYFIKSDLREHMNKHNEVTFRCAICDKAFYSVAAKNKHTKIHDDSNRIHQCIVCPKKFLHLGDRNVHMQVHTGHKPHECDLCKMKFRFKYEVGRHKVKYHGDVDQVENGQLKTEETFV